MTYRSPAIDRAQATREAASRPPAPRDLTSLTPDEFRALDTGEKNRFYVEDPDAYARLRDAR